MSDPFRATVSAIPHEGHNGRSRGGPKGKKLRWGKTPVDVMVADKADYAASPMVLSYEDWKELQSDPQIRAIARGNPADADVAEAKGELAKANAKIEQLRAELASLAEAREDDRRGFTAREERLVADLRKFEGEVGELRSQLARAAKETRKAARDRE